MPLDDFQTSTESQESDDTVESEFKNCRIKPLTNPDSLSLPDYVSVWVSDDGLMAMMEVSPSYFRKHVSEEVKDQAKEKGHLFLDTTAGDPVIVLTDDPEEYGELLDVFGLEDYLHKRVEEAI